MKMMTVLHEGLLLNKKRNHANGHLKNLVNAGAHMDVCYLPQSFTFWATKSPRQPATYHQT